ncbi:MAG TPA: hypothetical protein VGN16_12730 [Acidobacteriaceae bacterium]|jgi:hypothetical protein
MPETYDYARFKTRDFHSSGAHVPPGGLGCFYADYKPTTGIMTVTVKVAPRFVNPSGGEVPDGTKTMLMDAFRDKVPQTWNNRFRFTLTKKGFDNVVVRPQFRVVEATIADAHYDLKIVNNERGAICVRTGEDPALTQLKDRKWDPYRGKLSAQFNLNAWDAARMTQANNMLTAITKPVEIAYTQTGPGHGSSLSIVSMERLRTFARDTTVIFSNSNKTPKVKITGPGGTGSDIAKIVSGILKNFGLKADYSHEKNGKAGFVTIALDQKQLTQLKTLVTANVQQFPQFAQHAIVHEYGHMLGLPDEYMCISAGAVGLVGTRGLAMDTDNEKEAMRGNTTTDQQDMSVGIEKSQVEFLKLCTEFRVPAPSFGRSNPNIMSSGTDIRPCHGVTVAHSLWRMTRHYCEMSDWRIDVI